MICPKCGNKTTVIDCGYRENMMFRRRKCLTCGIRFNTEEKVIKIDEQKITNTDLCLDKLFRNKYKKKQNNK